MPTDIVFRRKRRLVLYELLTIVVGLALLAAVFASPARFAETSTIASP